MEPVMRRILRINGGVKVHRARGGADGLLCLRQHGRKVDGDEIEDALGIVWVTSAVLFYPEAPANICWDFQSPFFCEISFGTVAIPIRGWGMDVTYETEQNRLRGDRAFCVKAPA